MSGFRIEGNTSGNVVEVDTGHNLQVANTLTQTLAGYTTTQNEIDSGGVIGTRTIRVPTASIHNRQSVGIDTLAFSDYFNATAQNTAVWKSGATSFTTAQASGYLVLNSSSITTTGAVATYQSYATFSFFGQRPLGFEFSEYRTTVPATNQQFDIGLFSLASLTSTATPLDGAYLRFTSNGLFGVINFNGVETIQQLLTSGQLVLNDNTSYRIIINQYRVEFWGASSTSAPHVLLAEVGVPAANGPPFSSLNLPITMRLLHTGTAGSAVQMKIANTIVTEYDTSPGQPASHVMASMGLVPHQGQNGGTMGTTALYSNSLAAGVGVVLTNTTAAAGVGFGGQFTHLPSLAVGTDGILCSYQNPATAVGQTGRQIILTGVRIQSGVTAAFSGGPVLAVYSLAFGHTAVSMATAEAVAAKAPRRIPLGMETFAATAAVGVLGSSGLSIQFSSPIVINPGEFVAVCFKNIGVTTPAGAITTLVGFDGYME